MRCAKVFAFLLGAIALLSLVGCGSGGNGSGSSPFSTSGDKSPIYGNISTATGKTGITMTTDKPSIDVDNGQVLVTAKVVSDDVPVAGVPVTFSITAPVNGPATIEAGLTTVRTDVNGVAITRVTAGNWPITTNVIVQGTATIGGRSATATTTFQIVRGGGVIMLTDVAGTKPGQQSNMLDPWKVDGVDPAITPYVSALQLLPFKVTDSNGNPRVGVPVTLSVYSVVGSIEDVDLGFAVAPPTDSAGMSFFNIAVTLKSPPIGGFTAGSVVFKAATNDPIPVTAYVGGSYSLTAKKPDPAPVDTGSTP